MKRNTPTDVLVSPSFFKGVVADGVPYFVSRAIPQSIEIHTKGFFKLVPDFGEVFFDEISDN